MGSAWVLLQSCQRKFGHVDRVDVTLSHKEKQMRKILLAAIAVIGLAASASAQFCPGCLQNTTAVQNATFNITSATIRGPLYAGSITLSSFTATSSVTAANFVGSGTYVTNLNASQLLLGT